MSRLHSIEQNTKGGMSVGFDNTVDSQTTGLSNTVINTRVMPLVGSAILATAAGVFLLQGINFWVLLFSMLVLYGASIFTLKIPVVGTFVFYMFAFVEGGLMIPLLKMAALTISPLGVALCFVITSGIFFSLAAFAMISKKDFTNIGGFLAFGLIAIILLQVLNMIFGFMSAGMMIIMSSVTVGLMCGFILYDISCIKSNYSNDEYVIAAFQLYLDFIIIFQHILRIAILSASDD